MIPDPPATHTDGLPHLAGLLPDEIQAYLAKAGLVVRPDEARRLLAHTLSPTGARDRRRHPLARMLQRQAAELFDQRPLRLLERVSDPEDGFVKYLFQHADGTMSEAVRIPLHMPGRYAVCLSSQVGCGFRCAFCATGRLGWVRNLCAWEMVMAFVAIREETVGRITSVVFMGQGEPFANYDETMRAATLLSHPCVGRIGGTAVSVSTVGLVPELHRFTREARPHRLIISLNSALPDKRRWLMPGAARYSLGELREAMRDYTVHRRERVTLAWVLLAGLNTGEDETRALQDLCADIPVRFSLIDLNQAPDDSQTFRRPAAIERQAFVDRLRALGMPVVRRYSGGVRAHAACGMLAARRLACICGSS